ncbi:MAG: site-specific DNA-methyltransferase [Anaerolineae bacterium]|nr:site-specific DNA-methyltransferase [Anaerolineae bacterium]
MARIFRANHSTGTALSRIVSRHKTGGVTIVGLWPDATINGSETGTSFRQALYAMDCGFNLHDTMFYHTHKPPLQHNRYEQSAEYMFVFSKGRPKTTNLIRVPSKYHGIDKRRGGEYTHYGGYKEKKAIRNGSKRSAPKPTKIKSNLWHYNTGAGHSGDRFAFKHPATFPEQLAHDHIISWSNPGDIVLDPMMGSGTTGKMAMKVSTALSNVRLDADYFRIAEQRIANAAGDIMLTR